VISHDANFVTIRDLYPKSSVHLLLLPRDASKYDLHPFEAFEDPVFVASLRQEAAKLKLLAAADLRRKYSRFSAQDSARNEAMNLEPPPTHLPPAGRDWSQDIVIGVHAHPSMSHLHIHIISVDRVVSAHSPDFHRSTNSCQSECMKHRKHYNSFATPFLVPLDDFPLAEDDERRHPGKQGYLDGDLKCWRCGKDFKNKFQQLKAHLEEELESWKKL